MRKNCTTAAQTEEDTQTVKIKFNCNRTSGQTKSLILLSFSLLSADSVFSSSTSSPQSDCFSLPAFGAAATEAKECVLCDSDVRPALGTKFMSDPKPLGGQTPFCESRLKVKAKQFSMRGSAKTQ
ncbi:Hypothetical predicted protein [Scomber scombrus]|uniref:Uncharacterized protein n=1 Tax=Scomber scombrus TaxID=13677 RepID=A0AAV1PVM2_SCOSC